MIFWTMILKTDDFSSLAHTLLLLQDLHFLKCYDTENFTTAVWHCTKRLIQTWCWDSVEKVSDITVINHV